MWFVWKKKKEGGKTLLYEAAGMSGNIETGWMRTHAGGYRIRSYGECRRFTLRTLGPIQYRPVRGVEDAAPYK